MSTKRMLLVETDRDLREMLPEWLELYGCSVETLPSNEGYFEKLSGDNFDVVMIDAILNKKILGEMIVQAKNSGVKTVCLISTSFFPEHLEKEFNVIVLGKPFKSNEIKKLLF